MSSLASKLIVSTIGLSSKAFFNLGYCGQVTVTGLPHLIDALHHHERENGRGVITLSNHISTLDDPLTWGILPAKYYWNTRFTRWVLGASDIIFTNPVYSTFFRRGQVLETFRGNGVFQPAVDDAIEKLNKGDWIHLFGEGKVNQPAKQIVRREDQQSSSSSAAATAAVSQHHAKLLRFKWGVGRILMEVKKPPIILPMWLTGFDELMPEGRPWPNKHIPRPGVHLSITFGKPMREDDIKEALINSVVRNRHTYNSSTSTSTGERRASPSDQPSSRLVFDGSVEQRSGAVADQGWLEDVMKNLPSSYGGGGPDGAVFSHTAEEIERTRSALTAVVQRGVEALGKEVSERMAR